MHYSDPKVDAMIEKAMVTFDEKKRDAILARHATVDNARDVVGTTPARVRCRPKSAAGPR